jgi:phosphate-selective porin OprO and OprP
MKKNVVVLAGMLAVVAVCQSAQARSLEEILKEKGVITEADLKSVAKPSSYLPGKGLTFTSADEKYSLTLSQHIQLQYGFAHYEDPKRSDVSDFNLRRVKTAISGYAFSRNFTYKTTYNFAQLNSTPSKALEDVNIKYRFMDELQVQVGQAKTQFSRSWITPYSAQQFVDGSYVRSAFYQSYDTGVNLHGDIMKGILKYDAGVFSGAGQNVKNADSKHAYNFRISADPLGPMKVTEGDLENSPKPLVSLGASYYLNTLSKTATTSGATTTTAISANNLGFASSTGWLGSALSANYFGNRAENLDIDSFETDLAFKWRGASFQGEYLWGQAKGKSSQKTAIANGGYLQCGYFVIPEKLELAVRYNWMSPNLFSATNDRTSELQGGVNYFLHGNDLKVQADVTNRHTYKTQGDDITGRLQAQFIF